MSLRYLGGRQVPGLAPAASPAIIAESILAGKRSMTEPVDKSLDARGLRCPLPLLRAKQALNTMTSGQLLEVFASDPKSIPDFGAYCRQAGHELLRAEPMAAAGEFCLWVRKA